VLNYLPMEEQANTKVFIDHVGHTIVGDVLSSDGKLRVKNPAILIASPNNTGQLTVQLVPVFFKEFVNITVRDEGVIFNYDLSKIVMSEVNLDERLLEQYVNMFKPTQRVETKEAPTIKLFDE
jgi:hypothetical protein